MQTLLRGARVYDGHGFECSDILISNGNIVAAAPSLEKLLSSVSKEEVQIIDLNNKYIFPGFVDVHVHFREPGFSYKEDIKSGSEAAAAGGYTDVCTMPNLNPVPDSIEHLEEELKPIRDKAVIHVHPYASLSVGELGEELSDIEEMADKVIGFSDDGKGLASDELMLDAMQRVNALNGIIAAHCEDMSVIKGKHIHDGELAKLLGIDGITSESEWKMVERDVKLAAKTGCKYHVCHVSSKETVDIIRKAKAEGIDVTCETGTHYLLMNENDIINRLNEELDKQEDEKDILLAAQALGRFKMNPPIRTEEDRKALVEGILDGTIDMIATDHAPHSKEEKEKGLLGALMGVVGLETAFPVLYTGFVKTGVLSLEKLVELMSTAPAKRFEIASGIAEGMKANLCVYDLEEEYTVDPSAFKTRGRYSPFDGHKVFGRCLMTICDGQIVYERVL